MRTLALGLLVMSIASGARAETVLTTPMFFHGDQQCVFLNAGKSKVEVNIEMFDQTGVSLGSDDFALEPGRGTLFAASAINTFSYCRFKGRFSAKSVRAGALSFTASGVDRVTAQ